MIVVFVITITGAPLISFYFAGKSFGTDIVYWIEDNLFIVIVGFILVGLVSTYFVAIKSNKRVVVSFMFSEEYNILEIATRRIIKSSIKFHTIPYDQLEIQVHKGNNFLFVDKYKGYKVLRNDEVLGYFFIDHFTWCDQKREIKYFIQCAKPFLNN